MSFGKWVRKSRQEAGLTQTELADILGVSQGYISGVEKDTERDISKTTARKFADALKKPEREALFASGLVTPLSSDVEYIVNIDELIMEGANDYEFPPEIRQKARAAATRAASQTFQTIAEALREARRDDPGLVPGAGPVDGEEES